MAASNEESFITHVRRVEDIRRDTSFNRTANASAVAAGAALRVKTDLEGLDHNVRTLELTLQGVTNPAEKAAIAAVAEDEAKWSAHLRKRLYNASGLNGRDAS